MVRGCLHRIDVYDEVIRNHEAYGLGVGWCFFRLLVTFDSPSASFPSSGCSENLD